MVIQAHHDLLRRFLSEGKSVSRASVEQEGSVHVPPGRGACGRGMEAIEGVSKGIHVDDQFDQSSKNFQLAAPSSNFFSAKREKSTEISSRGKKKRGCPSNFYWTGRTGCRHRFGLFSLCRDPCHMLSRLLWVGPVTDPPLLLFQPPFKKFLLEERNFFKGD